MNRRVAYYPVQNSTPTHFPDKPFRYPKAWTQETLKTEDYLFPIPEDCMEELEGCVASLRAQPIPTLMLTARMFRLDACHLFMKRVKHALDKGVGFAVLDRLPLKRYTDEEAIAVHWLLGSLMASPVAQKWNGQMIHHVTDNGMKGENSEQSTAGVRFHTDGPHALTPPQYLGLLCLRRAKKGGKSVVVNLSAVFNELLLHHPDVLPRGFRAFPIQRPERSRAPGSPPVMSRPLMFLDGGSLRMHYSSHKPRDGAKTSGRALDEKGLIFLDTVDAILKKPNMPHEFYLQRGQIEYLNNSAVGHERTPFEDHPEPDRKRHLVRVYFREQGRISYDG